MKLNNKKRYIAFCDDSIRYLLSDQKYPTGGSAVQSLAWIHGFIELGWKVEIITAYDDNFIFDKNENITFIKSYHQTKGIRVLRWLYYRLPMILKSLISTNSKYIYDGVPSNLSGIYAIFCLLLGKKFILRISNDFLTDDRAKKKYSSSYYFLLVLGYKLSSLIVVQNSYQFYNVTNRYPKKNIIKITNPYYGEIVTSPRLRKERKYIAWVGLFQYQKNLPLLFEIAKKYHIWNFKIAGMGYEKIDNGTKIALANLKNLQNVEFVGFLSRSEIVDFLSQAVALLNTSHYEGFSNTYLEAFSVGTPVVCPIQNDPNEIIQNNALGYSYSSSNELIEIFNKYLSDDIQFLSLSNNCIDYIRSKHSSVQKVAEIIKMVTND